MKIIIATDSFKGTLTANQACQIIADAIKETSPTADLIIKPMADGGEGTANAMITAAGGKWIPKKVTGPLPNMKVEAGFAWFEHDKTALVEMASASGLTLLSKDQLNPMKTTTYGTGQLIKSAIEYGAKKILLAVGGSATVDGGVGAAMALGWDFLDSQKKRIALGGGGVGDIETIVPPEKHDMVAVEVLCDVDNPLLGPNGAAAVYGPQKGATPEMVEKLEDGLKKLADMVEREFGTNIDTVSGAGAAGGLAAGAIGFMGAKVVSGIETVIEHSLLADEMGDADWVITGEGAFDQQSLCGKVIHGIALAAGKTNTPVAIIAGTVKVLPHEYQELPIVTAMSCRKEGMSIDEALKNAEELLYEAARKFAVGYINDY